MALETDNSKKYPIPEEIYRPYQLAIKLLKKGETERARTALIGLLEVYPDTTALLNSIGNTYFEEENFDKAEEYFLKTIEIAPDHPLALSNVSSLYSHIGKYEKAAEYARRAIKSYKESPIPWNTLGLYYARKGDISTALRYFLAAYSADESYLVAAYNAACAYTELKQHENALKYLAIAFADERYIAEASNDPDLDPLRKLPEFKSLILDAYDRHNIEVE